LIATHNALVVDRMRRRVIRLEDGKIVADEERGYYHAPVPVPVPMPVAFTTDVAEPGEAPKPIRSSINGLGANPLLSE
jgi:hypothetical protein